MFLSRISKPEFKVAQFELRRLKLHLADKMELADLINKLENINAVIKVMVQETTRTIDELYFQFLECCFSVFKFQASYLQALKLGTMNSESLKKAKEFNLENLHDYAAQLDPSRPSVKALRDLAKEISDCNNPNNLFAKINKLVDIPFPFVDGIETNPYDQFQRHMASRDEKEPDPLLLSVRLLTDNEPWANPQVLKPETQYSIAGLIKLNYLPERYTQLIIRHVSTTSDDFFILSLPEIILTSDAEYQFRGHIVFKYPQTTFDQPTVIRLFAQLLSPNDPPIYPKIIGYDELIAQIIDEKTFKYPTGYSKLNKKAWNIGLEIKRDLPHIEQEEIDHFMIILSSILNYSGYCANYSIYKGVVNLLEDEFRDRMIAYLSANPMLSQEIIKEGIIAGGRVEIRYKNIIVELKVEKSISDRTKMVEHYDKQPSAYASAVSAELSILCILDLTNKNLPPAQASNNVFTIPAKLHGFDKTTSKVAVIIIDGNQKNPSAY